MLKKEQFVNAMAFFDKYNEIKDNAVTAVEHFFEGNGLIFTGCDILYNKYLILLKQAMDLDEEDEILEYYLYESSTAIYSEPNSAGICTKIGDAEYKFCKITVGDKIFIIKNAEDLYDYIEYTSK